MTPSSRLRILPLLVFALTAVGPSIAAEQATAITNALVPAACETGIYRKDQTTFLSITKAGKGFGYTFSDGVIGNTQDAAPLVVCESGAVRVRGQEIWPKIAITEINTRFASHGVMLAGRLMEAPATGKQTPLVIYAHGSEESGWIDRARDPYQMVGRGVSVFVYDKRGTGLSEGEYTQNLPRLADDLVAASLTAKKLAEGRYGRFGLFGVSQGGWIAPLAATRAKAEFLGIGFGLVADIAEQDAEQVARQLHDQGYGDDIIAHGKTITDITARVVKSGYKDGLDELAKVQILYGKEPWFAAIKGGYTGVLLSIPVDELRSKGIPRFDKYDIDWSLKPLQVLSTVKVPQLWALAAEDRQAPVALTVERLSSLRKQGQDITMYLFPDTDHGMRNYTVAADGTRKYSNIAPGFYDLMADWAKGKLDGGYGKAYLQ